MNLYYLPWNSGCQSPKDIQSLIGGTRILVKNSHYSHKPSNLVIVWGHGHAPPWGLSLGPKKNILNHWNNLPKAINKLEAFEHFQEHHVPTPEWTTLKTVAKDWIAQKKIVVCRKLLSSREGKGIVIAKKVSELIDAPLYTKLFPKDKEYRVHVFKGKVIDYVQKKLKNNYKEIPNRCPYIRNTANGWIFARQGVTITESIRDVATQAIAAVGLDFGAVDLAISLNGEVVVFEINTAPGLEGTTITKYAEAIQSYKESLEN